MAELFLLDLWYTKDLSKELGSSISVWYDPWFSDSRRGQLSANELIIPSPDVATGYKPNTWGWYFTTTGRYTVKSGYSVLQELSEDGALPVFGPDV
ncbi:unnamed protein product [Microthlaspi erraticum]|uniref:Uncharacterized protein n=1 Tax=Microthlaspi erraticum TaxID=1685480 RepID=A0A6D2J7E0_9BRAS|nr:unnamed protein product [Microthlaspi erraticum]